MSSCFKAVWPRPSGARYEYYVHTNEMWLIIPFFGGVKVNIDFWTMFECLGAPSWA